MTGKFVKDACQNKVKDIFRIDFCTIKATIHIVIKTIHSIKEGIFINY